LKNVTFVERKYRRKMEKSTVLENGPFRSTEHINYLYKQSRALPLHTTVGAGGGGGGGIVLLFLTQGTGGGE
jgi:hypothetical protein